ncbi:MAG: outer membrane beta-barrel protein, partial [Gemmatimonadaceae bacterium]
MRTVRHFFVGGVLAAGMSLVSVNVVSAQSLGYVLMPTAERLQWDDGLAFKDDWLYGGRLGLLFGQNVELQPFYLFRNKYPIDAARSATLFGPASQGHDVDIQNFGANVQVNLGRGDVVPFIRGGGSILRLKPDSGEKRDRVAVSAGGGIRFNLGGLKTELFAEQLAFRLNPLNIFGVDSTSPAALGAKVPAQRNIAYGASVSIPLSNFNDAALGDSPLSGSTAPIEPFVGRLRYASAQQLDDQEVVGVRAGIDLTPQVGLRGYYWRGVNDDRDGTAPVASYGGEAQFNLNTGPGISPYIVFGAGRINYFDSFVDRDSLRRDDQGVLILGGGASLRLSDRVRLNAAVRDYVMTAEPKLSDVSSTDDLTHNTMISAGLTFSLGGASSRSRQEAEARRQRQEAERSRNLERARDV